MPVDHDVTHLDIYVRLAELTGKLDALIVASTERKQDIATLAKDLKELDSKYQGLDRRMSQVSIIGAIIALCLPIIGGWITLRLVIPIAAEQQQEQKR
jgi:hypothetical protein